MRRWQITQAVVLFCGALAISACDDVLEGKDDHPQHDDDPDCCSSGGGGVWHGGGNPTKPDPDDDPDVDEDPPPDPDEPPTLEISTGEITGFYENNKVRAFLGIPYAAPPVDELRFLAPREPEPWSEALDVTEFGHNCIQSPDSDLADQDEDCLSLNVWTPTRTPRSGLPVVVWFHGGDHCEGSASETRYHGTRLAEQNVIVVSVNYRLGPLGFFAHRELAAERGGSLGNQGLWDQQLALRWVHENIGQFGGDSDNVTIAGQGSGATDVCLHAVSPESRGLFAHVVQQSGGCTTYQPTSAQLQGQAQPWLGELSCDGDDLLSCLQNKSVKELYHAIPNGDYTAFVPGVDGDYVPDQPRHLFDKADLGDVSFLVGSNSEDGNIYYDRYPDVTTEDEYHAIVQHLFPEIGLKELCDAYPHDRFEDADRPYQLALSYLLGDGNHVCNSLDTALRARAAGADVYVYNFEGVSEGDAFFGAEIPYVFGTLGDDHADDEIDLSKQVRSFWTQFAREGNPDDGSDPTWEAISDTVPYRMNLAADRELLTKFRTAECGLWSDWYDSQFGN
jgi:para-nitrobenzyl esterase